MIAEGGGGSKGILNLVSTATGKQISSFASNTATVESLAFSLDGKILVDGGTHIESTTFASTGVIELWNISTGLLSGTLPTTSTYVNSVKFSPDGKILVDGTTTGTFTGDVELWSIGTGALIATLKGPSNDAVYSLAFSPDGKSLAAVGLASNAKTNQVVSAIDLWSVASATLSASINPQTYYSSAAMALSPDGATLANGGTVQDSSALTLNGWLGLWNVSAGKLTTALPTAAYVTAIAFSPDGTFVADGGGTSTSEVLELWNVSTGKQVRTFPTAITDAVRAIAISADSATLAAGGSSFDLSTSIQSGALELWNVATGKLIASLPTGASEGVFGLAFSPDGTKLAVCGYTTSNLGYYYGILELWDVATATLITSLDTGILNLFSVAFSPDGTTLADGGQKYIPVKNILDGGMETWDVASASRLTSVNIPSGTGQVNSICYSPDGRVVFAASNAGLHAFRTTDYSLLNTFGEGGIRNVAVPTSGTTVALNTLANQIEIATNPYDVAVSIGSVTLNPASVIGGVAAIATVTLSKPAPAYGAEIVLSSNNASVTTPSSVVILPAAASVSFPVKTSGVGALTTAIITAGTGSSSKSATLIVQPAALSSISLSPGTVTGGNSAVGMVTLSGAAATGGQVIKLSGSNPAASVPTSITVPAGQTQASFTITTSTVSAQKSVTISATAGGITKVATLIIALPTLSSVTLNPVTLVGGSTSSGFVTVSGAAPVGGMKVTLNSSSSSVTLPGSVVIPAGNSSVAFVVQSAAVASQKVVTVTAKLSGGSKTASLTVNPPPLSALNLNPTAVTGGKTSTGTISIATAAPAGGLVIGLTSSLSSVAVPRSVTVPTGKTSTTFTIRTKAVRTSSSSTITATEGLTSLKAVLTIS